MNKTIKIIVPFIVGVVVGRQMKQSIKLDPEKGRVVNSIDDNAVEGLYEDLRKYTTTIS
ncbi:hypothetical protein JDW15_04235 [Aerococcaceae bacterium zg-ZJ1578]|uniref:hypothetical protein n=1 Tax=Aerococcaceae bacterium zg-252 TaxID=2796928 RepID=UPI001A31338D|nr:hypothetical protein [Aerococcaceae bacterium zg-1578]